MCSGNAMRCAVLSCAVQCGVGWVEVGGVSSSMCPVLCIVPNRREKVQERHLLQ